MRFIFVRLSGLANVSLKVEFSEMFSHEELMVKFVSVKFVAVKFVTLSNVALTSGKVTLFVKLVKFC